MRYISIFALLAVLMIAGCNTDQPQTAANADPYANANANISPQMSPGDEEYWAKNNFDLQRVGPILERSRNPEEFERYINEPDGINNLDLNGDGYADYISVDEYYDPAYEYQRGMTMYTRFGPDEVQELGTAVFYRDDYNAPGARILLTGNDIIYGDNYYYETNWLEKALTIASFLFTPRQTYYRSPYYYDYYPPGYVGYEVVETPYYVSRIERLYPEPVFVYTTQPTFLEQIKIVSPYKGKWMEKIHAKLAKPRPEHVEFFKNNPPPRGPGNNRGRGLGPPADVPRGKGPPSDVPKGPPAGKPGRDDAPKRGNPNKPDNPGKGNPGGKPDDPGKGKPNDAGKGGGKGKKP